MYRFEAFLSEDMNYSSAIFEDFEEDLKANRGRPLETLESAQLRKMKCVVNDISFELLTSRRHFQKYHPENEDTAWRSYPGSW